MNWDGSKDNHNTDFTNSLIFIGVLLETKEGKEKKARKKKKKKEKSNIKWEHKETKT